MYILPVRAELFHTDRWTEIIKQIVDFHNIEEEPEN